MNLNNTSDISDKPGGLETPLVTETPLATGISLESDKLSGGDQHQELDHSIPDSVPALDELLDDCFLASINKLHHDHKLDIITHFKSFIKSLHCVENLNFLISIYNYECIYNSLFNKKPILNQRRNSVHSLDTWDSFKSVDNFPNNYFASTIDDIDESSSPKVAIWDDLRDRQLESDIDLIPSSFSSHHLNPEADVHILFDYWQFIINSFILPDTKYQVNLSSSATKPILDEFHGSDDNLPSPSIFLKAKREIVQLINDNVYCQFVKKYNRNCKNTAENVVCLNCVCGMTDRSDNQSPSSDESGNSENGDSENGDSENGDSENGSENGDSVGANNQGAHNQGANSSTDEHKHNLMKSKSSNMPSPSAISPFSPSSPSAKKLFKSFKSRASSPVSINSLNSGVSPFPQSPKSNSPALTPAISNTNITNDSLEDCGSSGSPGFKKSSNFNSLSSILTHLKLNKSSHNSQASSTVNSSQSSHSNSQSNLSGVNTPNLRSSLNSSPVEVEKKSKLSKFKK